MIKALRRLPLHHGENVRDLGGYPCGESYMIAWNRCYRSDDPYRFDEHDWKLLQHMKVDRILDLRSQQEQQMSPCLCEDYGIRHVSLPFLKEGAVPKTAMNKEAMKKLMESMKLDYVDIFKGAGDAIKTSLEEIADAFACGHAVLFHCTAGKDRTGILACVLLDLCGVSAYDILADYQVSATYNTEGVNQRFGKELLSNPMVAKMLASNVEMMQPLLDYLHETGCEQRLLDIGVSMDTIQTIRSHMMEKI